MSSIRRVYRSYRHLLVTYPYQVQSIQIATVLGLGDIFAQFVIEKRKFANFDKNRTLKYAVAGAIIGPIMHKWFKFLEKLFGHSHKMKTVIKKVGLDQAVFAPTSLAIMLTILHSIEGHEVQQIKYSLKTNLPKIVSDNYVFTPIVQFMNFAFVPFHFRVLFSELLHVFWINYTSWNRQKAKKRRKRIKAESTYQI